MFSRAIKRRKATAVAALATIGALGAGGLAIADTFIGDADVSVVAAQSSVTRAPNSGPHTAAFYMRAESATDPINNCNANTGSTNAVTFELSSDQPWITGLPSTLTLTACDTVGTDELEGAQSFTYSVAAAAPAGGSARITATYKSGGRTTGSDGATSGQYNAGSITVNVGAAPPSDTTAPTVMSINRADASPTNAPSVDWTVTFSESVTGVDATDFVLAGAGATGASITGVSGSGTTRTVSASTGADGALGLNLDDDDSIVDGAGNKLGGTGTTDAGDGSRTGQTYAIDKTAPEVSCTPGDLTVWYAANQSVPCSASDGSGSGLADSGDASFSLITNVVGGAEDASASTNSRTVTDNAGNSATAGPYLFKIDRIVPTVASIDTDDASPTRASSVNWIVTFSEDVTGVDPADFALAATGTVAGASITDVEGTGTTRTVTASTGTGDGTLGLNLDDDDSVVDRAGNALGGAGTTGAGDGSFTGQTYAIDKTAPDVDCTPGDLTAWYGANRTVPCTASDSGSDLKNAGDASFTLDTAVNADQETSSASTGSRTVEDNVGNSTTAGPYTFKVDRKAPVVTCAATATKFTLGQSPAIVTGSFTDGGSGPASGNLSAAADTSAIGSRTVSLSKTDGAGNTGSVSCSYSAIWNWAGFFAPLEKWDPNSRMLNGVKAGSAVPVKFSLGGNYGLDIFETGFPKYGTMSCAGVGVDVVTDTELALASVGATSNGLSYDATSGRYNYVWKTDKAMAGKCILLSLKYKDGETHSVAFQVMK